MNTGSMFNRKADRMTGIDAARGLAVLFMVFSHGLHWLYTGCSHDLIAVWRTLSLGDLATPVFFTLSGLSLSLSVSARLRKGGSLPEISAFYRKRFSHLFFIGACLSLYWGVLQVQALILYLLVTVFLFSLPRCGADKSRLAVLFAALLFLAGHQLLNLFVEIPANFSHYWGQFPLFAYAGAAGIGFFSSILLDSRRRELVYIISGAALVAASQLLRGFGFALHRFGAPASFILLGLGLSFLLIGLLSSAFLRDHAITGILAHVGRDALFLFVFHYAALFLPVYLLGFYNRLGPVPALLTAGSFMVIIIFTALRRRHSAFSVYQITEFIFNTAYKQALNAAYSFNQLRASRGREIQERNS